MTNCLEDIFAVHGLQVSIQTDNAPNFTSAEFEQYLCSYAIRHVTSIPVASIVWGSLTPELNIAKVHKDCSC